MAMARKKLLMSHNMIIKKEIIRISNGNKNKPSWYEATINIIVGNDNMPGQLC